MKLPDDDSNLYPFDLARCSGMRNGVGLDVQHGRRWVWRISARDGVDTAVFPMDHPIILFFLPLILTSSSLFKTTLAPL